MWITCELLFIFCSSNLVRIVCDPCYDKHVSESHSQERVDMTDGEMQAMIEALLAFNKALDAQEAERKAIREWIDAN